MNKFNYEGLRIRTPASWLDVTSELDSENPPFTLAKSDGYGVLQFSLAIYQAGKKADIDVVVLRELISDFSQSRELRTGFDKLEENENLLICAESFHADINFIRVWYCSDTENVVLVTYVCQWGKHLEELIECEDIVKNLQFEKK